MRLTTLRQTIAVVAWLLLAAILSSTLPAQPLLAAPVQQQSFRTLYVATTGEDTSNCLTATSACRTIGAAVNKATDGNTIIVANGIFTETITLDKDITLHGADAEATIIDGNQANTVIVVNEGATVTIVGVTIRNGNGTSGGGLRSLGQTTVKESIITENQTTGSVGGGGIYAAGLNLTLISSIVSGNTSSNNGGGILNFAALTLIDSTIHNNTAFLFGGGIDNGGTLSLINSTISNNRASYAGGIRNATTTQISGSTIAYNSATNVGSGVLTNGSVQIKNSIVAQNATPQRVFQDCFGTLSSAGYNLLGVQADCQGVSNGVNNDRAGTLENPLNPLLGSLQRNGGIVPTHAPLPGSPAVDTGSPAAPESGANACAASDLRGVSRPRDGDGDGTARCDIGSFEVDAPERTMWLDLAKRATPGTIDGQIGDFVTYEITITAVGGSATAILTDTIPVGLHYVDGLPAGVAVNGRQISFGGLITPERPLAFSYRAQLEQDFPAGAILESTAQLAGAGNLIQRNATVSVRSGFQGKLVLIIGGGDTPSAEDNLSTPLLDLIQRAQQASTKSYITTLVLLDGPGANDAYLYKLQPPTDPNILDTCPNYQEPFCRGRYQEGINVWRWSEDTANPYIIAEFIVGAVRAYPEADEIILSIVGHGGGWSPDLLGGQPSRHKTLPGQDPLGGMLWDEHPFNTLSTPALGQALRRAKAVTGRQIDLLYLDSCSMAMIEVAYEVRDSVDYLLASANTKWTSFPYHAHLSAINRSMNAYQIGQAWLRNEVLSLEAEDYPFTYSLINLRRIEELRSALDRLAGSLTEALLSSDEVTKARIRQAIAESARFESDIPGLIDKNDTYVDIANFAMRLVIRLGANTPIGQDAEAVRGAITDVIASGDAVHNNGIPWKFPSQVWDWGEAGAIGGLSIYLPDSGREHWKRLYYGAMQFARDTRWPILLQTLLTTTPPDAPLCETNNACLNPPGQGIVAPLHLTAESGATSILLRWSQAPGAGWRYRLMRAKGTNGSFSEIVTSDGLWHRDVDPATPRDIYCYQVDLLDQQGNKLSTSNIPCVMYGQVQLRIPDVYAAPGTGVYLPVTVSNADGLSLTAGNLQLTFDDRLFDSTMVVTGTVLSEGYRWEVTSLTTRGNLREVSMGAFALRNDVQPLVGAGTLLQLGLRVRSEAPSIALTSPVTLTARLYANGDTSQPISLNLYSGVFYVRDRPERGDVTNDGRVDAGDAERVHRLVLNQLSPTGPELSAGDVDGDWKLSTNDARMILSYSVCGLWIESCPSLSIQASSLASASEVDDLGSINVQLGTVSGAPGSIVQIPLQVERVIDWASGSFSIGYDPAIIARVHSVVVADAEQDILLNWSDDTRGLINIAVSDPYQNTARSTLIIIRAEISAQANIGNTAALTLGGARIYNERGQDFEHSSITRSITRQNGTVMIDSYKLFLPVVL
jgi:Clostripain family/Dockerin type I domain/Cohesin domain